MKTHNTILPMKNHKIREMLNGLTFQRGGGSRSPPSSPRCRPHSGPVEIPSYLLKVGSQPQLWTRTFSVGFGFASIKCLHTNILFLKYWARIQSKTPDLNGRSVSRSSFHLIKIRFFFECGIQIR